MPMVPSKLLHYNHGYAHRRTRTPQVPNMKQPIGCWWVANQDSIQEPVPCPHYPLLPACTACPTMALHRTHTYNLHIHGVPTSFHPSPRGLSSSTLRPNRISQRYHSQVLPPPSHVSNQMCENMQLPWTAFRQAIPDCLRHPCSLHHSHTWLTVDMYFPHMAPHCLASQKCGTVCVPLPGSASSWLLRCPYTHT